MAGVTDAVNSLVVVGLQWGDEGKGKVVDLLSARADVVVRFQGGNNAGHTLVVEGEQTILHLIPSGALHEGTVCVIGGGVVVDPPTLVGELAGLRSAGYMLEDSRLLISREAQLILPYHKAIDRAREHKRGKGKIGTTGRGIGPAYEDKAARTGLRMTDLLDEASLREKLRVNLEEKNAYLKAMLGQEVLEYEAMAEELVEAGRKLLVHIADTSEYLHGAISSGRRVLFEGAQGVMLDVDLGTYPFVTSSNTSAGAVCSGAGLPPSMVGRAMGISKAYTTRVGSGPFPTELDDDTGARLRQEGAEFGATTGRPRRCGWFDAVVVGRAVRLTGAGSIALTKLDVLTGLDPLRICTAYRLDGQQTRSVPASAELLERCEPVYEELEGWGEDISGVSRMAELPPAARRYIARLEELIGAQAALVSTGPGREETILETHPFD